MDKNLVMAIVDFLILLEFSDDHRMDEDTAIGAMEQLAYRLRLMSSASIAEFIKCIEDVSGEYGDKMNFVRTIPDTLALR